MASFVVVPVAFLLQGETVLIFWGNEDVLWYAIVAVALLSGLLVRLGLAHFKREYLLGREIDTLNINGMYRAFRNRLIGDATSVRDWYRNEIPSTLKQVKQPLMVVPALTVVSLAASYYWVVVNVPTFVDLSPERVSEFKSFISANLVNLDRLHENFPAPYLFFSNARTTIVFLLMGLIRRTGGSQPSAAPVGRRSGR